MNKNASDRESVLHRLRSMLTQGRRAFSTGRKVPYVLLVLALIAFPIVDSNAPHVDVAADAGRWILLALGLNIVVGYAGLLDLGYAAFFAIGSYSTAILASGQFNIHLSFWLLIFVSALIAAFFGIVLGAPTLRLRGDYLAIVTLGFGEIVPSIFRYLGQGSVLGNWTGGVNGIAGIDPPSLPFGISGPWSGEALRFLPRFDFVDPIAY